MEKIQESSLNVARKTLADITNLPQQPRPSTGVKKSEMMSIAPKDNVEQLRKENKLLMDMLAERNKIIELTGTEMKKLRVTLQKMQQQNQQLALSNSQMLAELNSGKDRLKSLQHELGCKNILLQVKNCEAKEKSTKLKDLVDASVAGIDDGKVTHTGRRTRSKSLGPPKPLQQQDLAENKRPCTRRQSARLKSQEVKFSEDVKGMDEMKLLIRPACESVNDNGSDLVPASVDIEVKVENSASTNEGCELGRPSLRPMRQAAKKVQSYKEIPLNVKMRRGDDSTL